MNIDSLFVILIVIAAIVYSIRKFYKHIKASPGSCCEGSVCSGEKPLCRELQSPFKEE